MSDIAISSYLCARLCHDLVGPIGAAQNGLDLITDEASPADADEAMNLITESIGQAVGRIKFYRLAFGVASKSLTLTLARDLVLQVLPGRRVEFDWPKGVMPQDFTPEGIRLVLNVVLTARELLRSGGLIRIDQEEGCWLSVSAVGADYEQVQLTRDALGLKISDEDLSSDLVPALLAGHLACHLGLEINVEVNKSQVSFRIESAD